MIVDIANGKVWRLSLTLANLNDGKQKLGANYSAVRKAGATHGADGTRSMVTSTFSF